MSPNLCVAFALAWVVKHSFWNEWKMQITYSCMVNPWIHVLIYLRVAHVLPCARRTCKWEVQFAYWIIGRNIFVCFCVLVFIFGDLHVFFLPELIDRVSNCSKYQTSLENFEPIESMQSWYGSMKNWALCSGQSNQTIHLYKIVFEIRACFAIRLSKYNHYKKWHFCSRSFGITWWMCWFHPHLLQKETACIKCVFYWKMNVIKRDMMVPGDELICELPKIYAIHLTTPT